MRKESNTLKAFLNPSGNIQQESRRFRLKALRIMKMKKKD
jgi:hypothetical protein